MAAACNGGTGDPVDQWLTGTGNIQLDANSLKVKIFIHNNVNKS
jgi:hypothetical protein